jgi:hypothetical protein
MIVTQSCHEIVHSLQQISNASMHAPADELLDSKYRSEQIMHQQALVCSSSFPEANVNAAVAAVKTEAHRHQPSMIHFCCFHCPRSCFVAVRTETEICSMLHARPVQDAHHTKRT